MISNTNQLIPKSFSPKQFRTLPALQQGASAAAQTQASSEQSEKEEQILENLEKQKKFRFWRNTLCVIIIGIAQILIGALLLVSGGQIFGSDHIKSGINEILSSGLQIFQGGFSWTEWTLAKCININVSIICGGFQSVSKGFDLFKSVLQNFWSGTGTGKKLGTDFVSQSIVSPIESLTKNFVLKNVEEIRQEVLMKNFVVQKALLLDLLKKDDFWNKILIAEAQSLSNSQGEILQRFILGVFLGVACNKSRVFSQFFAYFSKLFAIFKVSLFTHQLLYRLNNRIEHKYGDLIDQEIQNTKEIDGKITIEQFDYEQQLLENSNTQKEYNQQMDEFIQDQISQNFKDEFVAPVISKVVNQGVEYSTKNQTKLVAQNTQQFCNNFQRKGSETKDS